ncbi:efflux RND transporter periplasmic adaptor subunit [Lysobacter antibioticus]|uniref:Efflux transporter, RND family, MFP subunit n=1 Tax=Lysobacter antibioticus TaxID=84531 RepID=A0A0S2FDA8_LYSAN|nr:efflux RND transporter periplasmic adaptor subunit [Lysobacter antibioticus]ALN81548.1 efflux transporter, RND family, MFP subunit [Lysobacter antibioticus]
MSPTPVSTLSPRARKTVFAAAASLAVVAGGLVWGAFGSRGAPPPAPPPPVPVTTMRVERRDVPHWQETIGTVTSLQSTVLRPQVDGVLTQVLFREGQQVKRGQLLARIDDRSIAANLDGAQAALARDAAQLRAAKSDLDRFRQLSGSQLIARQMLEQQAASVQQLQATAQANQAAIDATRVQLSHTRILSPIDGRVGLRRVDPGNVVRAGDDDGLVTVQQVDPISVMFTLPQDQLPRLRQAQAAGAVEVQALDRDAGLVLAQGELSVIDNQIDDATGTVRIRAVFKNSQDRLWPGQLVSVRVRTGTSAAATVVASEAVQRGADDSFVYRVEAGNKVALVPVRIEYQDDKLAVVSGLQAGDVVVRDGQSRLKPGMTVAPTAPSVRAAPGNAVAARVAGAP